MTGALLPTKIRVSIGSAIILGLVKGRLDAPPTTIYLLTFHKGKCVANCGFCPQARTSTGRGDMLSRVTWPTFSTNIVVSKIASAWRNETIQRVCIQAINYPTVFEDLLALTTAIKSHANVAVSVSVQPLNKIQMRILIATGVDRVSIALDAVTEELFSKVKGSSTFDPYDWKKHQKTLKNAVQVFGEKSVSTHLIVGLGETERQFIKTVQWCVDLGVHPSLFAFTPISGTALERLPQPSIASYRRIQLAQYLIIHGKTRYENIKFNAQERITNFGVSRSLLEQLVEDGSPFQTSGCPSCNRPYYNEKPGGLIYNYPRALTEKELAEIKKTLEI
jgi:biotin synthase-related radical SAM superfamily protein